MPDQMPFDLFKFAINESTVLCLLILMARRGQERSGAASSERQVHYRSGHSRRSSERRGRRRERGRDMKQEQRRKVRA